ncbi:LamG-like jellyroll fold domain-containing protein [Chitinophaga sp. YIM B06452]|uniref:LamG-like jellyroll fold domain-containing protein n=1 Tax=Chitinophaga sp. YIM B06452 TaxID=3082158 RepID=UPI0031FE61F6
MINKMTRVMTALVLFGTAATAQERTENQQAQAYDYYEKKEKEKRKYEYAHTHTTWYSEMLKRRPDVRKAQTAFNAYFAKHPDEDSKLIDRFATWMQMAALYKDKAGLGGAYPVLKKNKAANTAIAGVPASPDGTFGTWKMIGPANMTRDKCGNNNIVTGGFCDRVYVNPYNTQNLFAGFSYGGLWVSKDQGGTWQLTDGSFANGTNTYANRDYYYGEIEAHKLNSDLVFSATEAGLLKSADGGINWTLLPQLNRNSSPTERPYFISLATDDQQVVLSTFGRKVYRSADGGNTWTVVFDNSAGGANHRATSQYNLNTPFGLNDRTYNFFGLEASFANPDEFYLGVWNGANQACIYKSTDKGASFSLLVNLNTTLSTGWTGTSMVGMKTIPSSPDMVSVFQQFVSNKPCYRISASGALLGADTIKAYVEAFDIDWNNKNIMYEGQYSPDYILKSIDSGRTFAKPYTAACNYLHADIRGISAVGDVVLVGNDGGLGMSTDGGRTIVGTGFEINSMDIWGFSSSPKSDIVLAGLDHNQTFVRSFDGAGGWRNIKGADAGVCSVNPYQDRWLYYDWAYGVNKGYLNENGTVTESSVAPDVDLGSLQFHPHLVYNIFGIRKSNNKILVQSSDNMSSSTVFKDFGETVNALRIARRDPKTMYALLSQKKIMKSIDSGVTWVDVTPSLAASSNQTNITAIETGKTPGELWAAYGNAQNTTKVLYSTDGGAGWTNITTANLPAAAVSDIAYQRGTNGGVYIITITAEGTKIWYRNNTMPQWEQVGSTLPMMGYIKGRLYVVPARNKIRFGSSRGAWENELYETSGVEANIAAERWKAVCSADSVQFYSASAVAPGAVTYEWHFPGGSPAVSFLENPKVAYTSPGQYDVILKVTNAANVSDEITLTKFVNFQADICQADTVAGKALDISGAATSRIPLKKLAYNSNTFTVTAWVKPSGLQKSFSQIVSVKGPSRLGIGFAFKGYAANTNLVVTNSTLSYGITSSVNLVPEEWNHIAVTYSPTTIKIYLNGGAPWVTTGNFAAVDFSQQPLTINDDIHNQGGNFKGALDELAFYSYTMTQEEIREKMHFVRRPASDTGLIAYYQFNQYDAASSTLYDAMGAGSSAIVGSSLITNSTAPVGTGISERLAITTGGLHNFATPGVQLNINAARVPNGEVVAHRLYGHPNGLPATTGTLSPDYWIIRNYGTNDSIAPLDNITFSRLAVTVSDAANPAVLKLFKRPENAYDTTWKTSICGADSTSPGMNGSITFGSSCGISRFGQFIIATEGNSFLPCTGGPIPAKNTWAAAASSEETVTTGASNGRAGHAIDGNPSTYWLSDVTNGAAHPHDLVIDLHACATIGSLSYLPRQDLGSAGGKISEYEIYISQDSVVWTLAAHGTWPAAGGDARVVSFTPQTGRYVKLHSLDVINHADWSSVAEINLAESGITAPLQAAMAKSESAQEKPKEKLLLYPNPAAKDVTITFTASREGSTDLKVYDVSGKLQVQRKIAVTGGANKVLLNTGVLQNGTYVLTMTIDGKLVSKLFVVSR